MRFAALYALSSLCLGMAVTITEAGAGNLGDAMQSALTDNAGLKAQRANSDAAGYGVTSARGALLPQISGSYEGSKSKSGLGEDYSDWEKGGSHSFSLTARQPIFQSGSGFNKLRKAKAQAASAKHNYTYNEQELLLSTGRAYVAAVRDKFTLEHQRDYHAALQDELRVAQRRFELGESTRTDVDLSQAQIFAAEASVAASVGAYRQSLAQLEAYVGAGFADDIYWPDFPIAIMPATLEEAIDLALRNNPQIFQKSESVRAAHYGVYADTGSFGPSVDATASYNRQYDEKFDNAQGSAQVGVQVNVPFFQGGRGYAAYKQAKATERQETFTLEETRVQVTQAASAAFQQMKAMQVRLRAAKEAVTANRNVLKGLKAEFQQGERSLSDVISGRSSLASSESSLEDARYNLWVAGLTLLNSMGKLTPELFLSGTRHQRIVRDVPPNLREKPVASLYDTPLDMDIRTGSIGAAPSVKQVQRKRNMKPVTNGLPGLRLSSQ